MSFHFFLFATNSLHFLTPSTWRSLSTSSFHPFLGLPLLLVPSISWVKIFLCILSSSTLSRWHNQLILCHFIHFTIFSPLLISSSSRFLRLFHLPFSYLGPYILSCKANARVKPAKMGHGPHSSKTFMLFYVLFVLCRSVYCLCVNVYCTAVTWWLPSCNYQIYRHTTIYGLLHKMKGYITSFSRIRYNAVEVVTRLWDTRSGVPIWLGSKILPFTKPPELLWSPSQAHN